MFNVRLAVDYLYGTWLFTWLSLVDDVDVLLFHVHGKHLRSYRDGQLT